MGIGVAEVLWQAARRWPDRPGITEVAAGSRRDWSLAELERGARRCAAALLGRGAGRGARVALSAANSAAFVQAWFGIAYAGATAVPIPLLSTAAEAGRRCEHARCALLLVDAERRASLTQPAAAPVVVLEVLLDEGIEPVAGPAGVADEDPAMLLYTSGTTGSPRGAVISHRGLLEHTAALARETIALTMGDVVLGVLPLTHSFGCRMAMLAPLRVGARMVLASRFEAAPTLQAARDERVTWIPAVPTMFAAWVRAGGPRPTGLRWCLCAGAPLSSELALQAEALLGAPVRQGYGMTEASFSTVNAPPDARVLGSVGRPVPGVALRVVGEDGRELSVGEVGEIFIRGPNVMSGYLDEPAATSRVLHDGWVRSGDLGRLDAEGRLFLLDRAKDLIIRGGNNVYPSEVEDALASHPAIAEVMVVGRPDPYYGEEIVAVVVPVRGDTIDPARLVDWARGRVGQVKYPREFVVLSSLPTGPSGKVLRRELRRRLAAGELVPERPARD